MSPSVSVVVVAYDMARELPRTLATLTPGRQRGIDAGGLEVVVVDNGSPVPVADDVLRAIRTQGSGARLMRLDDAPASPAMAANVGVAAADGDLVGLIVDGARMASPGLVSLAARASALAPKPVIATLGWHLGVSRHIDAESTDHQFSEDTLLATIDWETDGYSLFGISTFAASSGRGWFGPIGESSALFMRRETWTELGGLDPAFTLPGGGLVNHDLYRRACALDGAQPVTLLGEGTFHQFHGGASTSGRFTWDEMQADYERLRGERYRPPRHAPMLFGSVPPEALGHVAESVRLAEARMARRSGGGPT